MPNRSICIAALLLLSGSALAQNKTLTFDNTDPDTTVHLLNGTSVSIGTTGNLVAQCVLNGTKCADVGSGTGGGGAVPSVSISASNFSTPADGNNAYSAGTTFTITPAVTSASVCWRRVIAGPASGIWTGATATNLNNAVTGILLGTASTSYTFRLDCFNADGGAGAEVTVTTSAAVVPPPTADCPDAGWVPTLAEYQFTRNTIPSTWQQIQGAPTFPDDQISSSLILVPKSTISGLVYVGATRGTYSAIKFTTPSGSHSGSFAFDPSQIPGTVSATNGGYYMTISRCPGDFRYGIVDPQDSSEGQSCKSKRRTPSGSYQDKQAIGWNLTGVTGDGFVNNKCGLQPGTTYYLNYANVNPHDGFDVQEHICPNNLSGCGVQFKSGAD